MNEQDKHKDKPLYKDPVKMVPLIGATIAAILGGIALYNHFSPPSNSSFEYVLDTSQGMKGKLGKMNKLQSVTGHILAQVAAIPDVPAALRLAGGGGCRVNYEPPSVGFEEDNYDDFETTLAGLRPSGKSNLANALKHAANDLVQRSKQESNEVTTVYVFLGSTDYTCTPNAAEAIHTALITLRAEENVLVDFKFVGVKPSKKTQRLLDEVHKDAEDLGFSSDVTVAKKPSDLDKLPCDTPAEEEYSGDCP
jgi:hypothetical protein